MNKGTAIVGFLLSFIAGMFLMWGIDRKTGVEITQETGSAAAGDHAGAKVPVTSADPSWGNADAPVTIVEISDFECPFCSRVGPTLKQIKEKYGKDKVRIVWKHNPLPFHKNARGAHEAAATVMALSGSDAFWKFHDSAFANQKALNDENYEKWAAAAGVDAQKFKAAYSAKKYAQKVDDDMAMSKSVGASGTPAFRVNGVTISGAQPFEKFAEVIDAQLAEANKLIASGVKKSDVYVQLTNKNATSAPAKDDTAKKEPPEDDKSVWKVPVMADDPIRGPKDALVTMIIFSDYQCPFCKRVEDTLKQVTEAYPNDLRIVWKDNALPFHPRAKPTAVLGRFAYEKKGDKGYWEAHDAMFESAPKLEDADLQAIAEKLGLNWDAIKAAAEGKGNKYMDKIDQSMEIASDFQARGTPHFFINGVRLSGAQPLEKFKAAIDEQLAKAKALVAKGVPKAKIYEEVIKEGKEPQGAEKKNVAAPDASSPYKGGANAKVVIQEFSEFQCPFCKKVNPTMKELEQEYGNKIKIVWRHLPLPFHKEAPLAAEAAQEAFAQKGNAGFWAMHDKLFDNQSAEGLSRENLEKLAGEIGLDVAKFKAALDARKHKAKVEADAKVGNDAGINGTPGFVINGYYLSGAQPTPAFKKLIDKALKEAK